MSNEKQYEDGFYWAKEVWGGSDVFYVLKCIDNQFYHGNEFANYCLNTDMLQILEKIEVPEHLKTK